MTVPSPPPARRRPARAGAAGARRGRSRAGSRVRPKGAGGCAGRRRRPRRVRFAVRASASASSGRAWWMAKSRISIAAASGWRAFPAASAISSMAAAGSTGRPGKRWSASQGSSAVSSSRVQRPGSAPSRKPSSGCSETGSVSRRASVEAGCQTRLRLKGVGGRPRRVAGPAKAGPSRGSAPAAKARSAMAGKGSPVVVAAGESRQHCGGGAFGAGAAGAQAVARVAPSTGCGPISRNSVGPSAATARRRAGRKATASRRLRHQ